MITKKNYHLLFLIPVLAFITSCAEQKMDEADYWDLTKNDVQRNFYSGPVKSVHYRCSSAYADADGKIVYDVFKSATVMNFDEEGYYTDKTDTAVFFGRRVPISYVYTYKENEKLLEVFLDDILVSQRIVRYVNNRPFEVIEMDNDGNEDSKLSIEYDEGMFITRITESDSLGAPMNISSDYVYNDAGYPLKLNYVDLEEDIRKISTYKFDDRNLLENKREFLISENGDTVLVSDVNEEWNEEKKLVVRNAYTYNNDGSLKSRTVTKFSQDYQWWNEELTYDADDNLISSYKREISFDEHNNCTKMVYYYNGELYELHTFKFDYYE